MSAKTFLIAHGEKLAVVAVAGGCALILSGSINDPTIKPKDDLAAIDRINTTIDVVFKKQAPPVLKEPRAYLDQMLGRLGQSGSVTPTMAWLTNPPDKGRAIINPLDPTNKTPTPTGTYIYVYELLAPTVNIEDAIGSLKISVEAPKAATTGQGRRFSSDSERRWERTDHRGVVANTGRHLGVQVQIKVGDNEWRPLPLPGAGKDGILPIASLGTEPVTIPTPEPWQRHQLRARIVAAATALDLDGERVERPRETVVVASGQLAGDPTEDAALLDKILAQYAAKQGQLFKTLLRPEAAVPASLKLNPGEKAFLGPWSPVAKVDATASVRFALLGLSTAPLENDPTKTRDVGRFLLLRLFQQGEQREWMKKPLEAKFGEGDVLGAKDVLIDNPFPPNKPIRQNLETPFVVEKIIKGQSRVLYYSLKVKARQGGGKNKDLEIERKETPTDVVVLRNPDTGSTMELTRLITINPPVGKLIYPHRAAAYVEKDDFVAAPSSFRQWGLVPEPPKLVPPETGPLVELHKAKVDEGALDAASYTTDTPYVVFPDGRLVWWDTIEPGLKIHDPEGVMEAKAAATPTPEAATEKTDKADKPAGKPPVGQPPEGMPPEGVQPVPQPPAPQPPKKR